MGSRIVSAGLTFLWLLFAAAGASRAEVVVSEKKIHDAVTAYVQEQVAGFDGEAEVSVRWQGDLVVDGVGSVDLQVRADGARNSARVYPVVLEIHRGPAMIRQQLMSADVRYFQQVLVATRPIRRGDRLTPGSVTKERREVTTQMGRYATDLSKLAGMQAKATIGMGQPVDLRYLQRIPVVERRDRVRIEVHVGAITASTAGIAKEPGAVGDRILVQNLSSRQDLLAEVVGPGVVRAVF